jgi:4'-phosphopantetheinyl transferase
MNAEPERLAEVAYRESAPCALAQGDIHLWLSDYDEVDASLFEIYRGLLNEAEREQEQRFHFVRDRRRYLVTRALVRSVLSRYVPIKPAQWTFSTNPYGKPHPANPEALDIGLSFNVSHTAGTIALGLTRYCRLGVDIENFGARDISLNLARRYFAAHEANAVADAPESERRDRFFEYWTFKEAYIKARGMGLHLPLDSFGFHFPSDRSVEVAMANELEDSPAHWKFWQYRPKPDCLLAICAERCDGMDPQPIIRQVVPLVGDWPLAVDLTRKSE